MVYIEKYGFIHCNFKGKKYECSGNLDLEKVSIFKYGYKFKDMISFGCYGEKEDIIDLLNFDSIIYMM